MYIKSYFINKVKKIKFTLLLHDYKFEFCNSPFFLFYYEKSIKNWKYVPKNKNIT